MGLSSELTEDSEIEVNKSLQKKWIHALESGEYKQGTGRLCKKVDDSKQFCCLGVLCDLIDPTKWKASADKLEPNAFDYEEELNKSMPPAHIRNQVGIYEMSWELAHANDGNLMTLDRTASMKRFTFAEIAEILRAEFDIWD